MSLWSRFKSVVAKVFGADTSPPVQPERVERLRRPGPSASPTPFAASKPTVLEGPLRHARYGKVWQGIYQDFNRALPPTAIEEYNDRERRFHALFDVWSDPSESDDVQLAAYEAFWDDMADFGYSVADFDWADFKQKYESLGG